jgi:hypothetical protein
MRYFRLFSFSLLCLVSSCKTSAAQPNQNSEVEWSGPGWYWGVYIDNEDDYRNHYNNQGHQDNSQHPNEGDRGGSGHGGGGHGGGGHR